MIILFLQLLLIVCAIHNVIVPLKKVMYFTQPLGLSMCLCVSVRHKDCDEMAGLSSTLLNEALTAAQHCNITKMIR